MLVSACGKTSAPTPSVPSPTPGHAINPSRIKRIGRELPSGYEVTSVTGVADPASSWGLGSGWTADPPPCAVLADPAAGRIEPPQGVSGSGAGGIVYVVVTPLPAAHVDPAVVAGCPRWTVTNGRARSDVRLVDAPRVDGAQTLGMTTDTTTQAEGGKRIGSHAETVIAYLGDYYAFTTVVTDPGSAHPPLSPQFAADLLAKTVAALRG